jgi:alpha/beta hydrolase family protein
MPRRSRSALLLAVVTASVLVGGSVPAAAAPARPTPTSATGATVAGPLPGTPPGTPSSPDLAETYPWLATNVDLASLGYVEQEFYISGTADGFDTAGNQVADDVPYKTRVIVRRPVSPLKFNGTVLAEWQNVSGGYDLDALWSTDQITRPGYAWVGISAQRVGVNHLRTWSPARYGDLDVTGGGRFMADELSYDIFAQAAQTLRRHDGTGPMGRLWTRTLLGIGASQSAGRMTVYYNNVLPKTTKVFDGYGFIVGSAPTRQGTEPVFQVMSETDVRTPVRPADTATFRRWEVAGSAHSGWHGQQYRAPILTRDLGAAPTYQCARPPFSRVPLHHVIAAAYDHLVRWVERGTPPPSAPPLEFNADGTKARDELGLAKGGIRLSQVTAPTALNNGDNAGETFCVLFGTHIPFDQARLAALYPTRVGYLAAVAKTDLRNVSSGYLLPADAARNYADALASGVGGSGS